MKPQAQMHAERELVAPSPRHRLIPDRAEAVRIARALAPELRERSAQADAERRVPAENIARILDAGLFDVMRPRAFGGSELGLEALVEVTAEIAEGCGSTGWLFGVLGGHNWMTALFGEEAQREVFGDPDALVASVVRLGGHRPQRTEGGFRIVDGVGKFCSGIDHSSWIMVGASVGDEGEPAEARYFLVPKADAEVSDDWFTTGMRGSGSRSIRIRDAFVPAHRSITIASMVEGVAPGAILHGDPIYRSALPHALTFTLAGVPIGIARAALAAYVKSFRAKSAGWSDEQLAENSATLLRISKAHAAVDSAARLLFSDAREIDADPNGSTTPMIDRTRHMRDIAFTAGQCRTATNDLFEAAGASAIYETGELQRIWRDMNAAAAHLAFSQDRSGVMFARALLGLPQSKFVSIGH